MFDRDPSGSVLAQRRTPVCATTVGAESDTRNDRIRSNEEVLINRILEGEKDLFLELIRPYPFREKFSVEGSLLNRRN
jgi:hypothetical protein